MKPISQATLFIRCPMTVKFLERSFWQRILGISATAKPGDETGWSYNSGELIIELSKTPELSVPGSAVRIEGPLLPKRVLVLFDEDRQYRAFHNQCTHFGHRRLDYVPGTQTVQCCSVNKSTYTFAGKKIHGPNPKPINTFPLEKKGEQLHIRLS